MGTGTLPDNTTVASGLLIKSADFLKLTAALQGEFVGRNTSGVATSGQSLGTVLLPWGNIIANALTLNGSAVDVSQIVSPANRIVSGAVRTTSGQPQFLQADGAAASVDILGATTNLVLSINAATVTVSTDITETGLTTAPGSNNTCAINDTYFADQADSKYFGEVDAHRTSIPIDTVGTEISGRVGQMISLKTASSEIMFGWLKSATEFTAVKRGFFFDDGLDPIVRETLANNDTLTLMETGWIFVENDGTSIDVTYTTPVYAYDAPSGPSTGDYWYDISNVTWKRWSGSAWVDVGRVPVGLCVMDSSNCIATRSFDFHSNFSDENTFELEVFSDEIVRSTEQTNSISIYGNDIVFENYPAEWDNTADMETGGVAADTTYYLYLSTNGEPVISTERPYDRTGDLRGRYHPYNNWRYVADAKTDFNSDWLAVIGSSLFDSRAQNAGWEAEGLEIEVLTVSTVSVKFKKLVLTNDYGQTKTIYNGDVTLDMAVHIQGTELASTWYQIWFDADWNMKLVPDLTGTADTNTVNKLIEAGQTFQTYGVQKGDTAYNKDDNTNGAVDSTDSETQLGFTTDLFPDGNEDYVIHMLNPVGLGEFKANIGAVYNDSGSDLDVNAAQIGKRSRVTVVTAASVITSTTPVAVDLSAGIPVTAKELFFDGFPNDGAGVATLRVSSESTISTYQTFQIYNATGSHPGMRMQVPSSIEIESPQKIWAEVASGDNADIYITGYRI